MQNLNLPVNLPQIISQNRALLWMTFGGFAFATMAALVHALGNRCDWVLIVFVRMFLSFILVFYMAISAGVKPYLFTRGLLWFRCLIGTAGMFATFYALTELPVSDVSVITETRPIWVALVAGFLLGESSGGKVWISVVCGVIGVILLEKPHFDERNIAVFMAIFAAFAGAIVMICLRKLRDVDHRVIVIHFTGFATLASLIWLAFFRDDVNLTVLYNPVTVIMLIGVGVSGTVGQLAMTKAFSIGRAPSVASAGYAKVGFAAAYDILIFGRQFGLVTTIGMILILLSTTWLFYGEEKSPIEEVEKEAASAKAKRIIQGE